MLRLVVASLAFVAANAIVCGPNACKGTTCPTVTAESCVGGTFVSNGGLCGCCDICIHKLAENETCMETMLMGVPHTSECGDGLMCDPATATCKRMTCAERLHKVQTEVLPSHLLGVFVPRCEPDGTYSAVQCQGSVCYCVAPNGVEIEGYSTFISLASHMDCRCARDQYAYMRTGLVGRLFTCSATGNYLNYACTGSSCYCIDELGAMKTGSQTVEIAHVDTLQC